ncbi:helix-turn-helix domain-containing protein [Glycomyces algeriensis]|uniref:Helix-turn-helix transcriptional regulator n=1 Tax=Glycomyces algeriensis TaxID=256037 RepID=A0A9W6LH93_9ACTN|nr:helix-turn-helix transcriptional regulator [Glycomyces algeriensis]MDA1364312.1 helix-turn-helix transcriptional regulator [Glycomyces algeriensis]MDR7350344.1 DNA-binding CsgD family transcriptional regulator [Glycomyces algeriensis]GLI43050.1 helix-turn-helix transcriptional regulator [Glycomyces algeriensis]
MTDARFLADVTAEAERADDALALFTRASARLRRRLRFDSAVWAATDPDSGLITAPMLVEGLGPSERCGEYWKSELLEENVAPFRELARAVVPAIGLRAATGDLPARSARYRRLLEGQGVSDELRAVLRIGDRPWAVLSLFRNGEAAPFGPDETALLAELSRPLALRLRRFTRPPEAGGAESPPPGLVLFDGSGEATSINDEARRHLALLPEGPSLPSPLGLRLPIWIAATAMQARAVAEGRDRGSARMRIRTVEGRWLTCHASTLTGPGGSPGPVALVIEPAPAADLAALIAEAYGLTPRELEIAELVARGRNTTDIAAALHISPHTVRDHLKAVFAKADVSTRGELVARILRP